MSIKEPKILRPLEVAGYRDVAPELAASHEALRASRPSEATAPLVRCWCCKHDVPEDTTVCKPGIGTQCKDTDACRARYGAPRVPPCSNEASPTDRERARGIAVWVLARNASDVDIDAVTDFVEREFKAVRASVEQRSTGGE